MDNSGLVTYIGIGVGVVAILLGGYYTYRMGCNSSVHAEKYELYYPCMIDRTLTLFLGLL